MKPRLDALARVFNHLVIGTSMKRNVLCGRGWRSFIAHAWACHVVRNRRNARLFRFRETTGWRYWS